ncbi:MAG: hypothetical protein PHR16_11820 [Methylovulum sp.]|nr:hypothetical protein [Methylovulum sp.]
MANHYLIIETAEDSLNVKTLVATRLDEQPHANDAAASELLDFLTAAAQIWLETKHMPIAQALAHVKNLTTVRH